MSQHQCSFAITFLFPGLDNFPQTLPKSFLFSSTPDNRDLRKEEVRNLLNYWSFIICSFTQLHHFSIRDLLVRSGLVQEGASIQLLGLCLNLPTRILQLKRLLREFHLFLMLSWKTCFSSRTSYTHP